jgi:hypothetical protein
METSSGKHTVCIQDSAKSCMTLDIAGAESSAHIGRSVIPAAIWLKVITPDRTAIAPDVITQPVEDGWKQGLTTFYPYPIITVPLPCPMFSIPCAGSTGVLCMTLYLNIHQRRCLSLDITRIVWERPLAFTVSCTPGAVRCGHTLTRITLQPPEV